MAPPHLPLTVADHAALTATVAREWPDAARAHGVDPERIAAVVRPHFDTHARQDGFALYWMTIDGPEPSTWDVSEQPRRALSRLAERLEDLGYAVDWTGVVRVVGWAVVNAAFVDIPTGRVWTKDVRVCDLAPYHSAHEAYTTALSAARAARRGPGPAPDAKREGARQRDGAAYGRGGRR